MSNTPHHKPDNPSINPDASKRLRSKQTPVLTTNEYIEGIRSGNRSVLSRAITLVESTRDDHQQLAREIIEQCLPYAGQAMRIGITGVPGVGKSTFIEAMGMHLVNQGKRLAVLAVDPSSERTQGSILGDKTRMNELAASPQVYIRPSPSAGTLGGVARKTRETMILFEAAGYDVLFIETVGVGQSETAVHSMVDFFLLLMLAGAGDELQGIKRGIMEMADAILITKADGDNLTPSRKARSEYRNALHLFPPAPSGWSPRVEVTSALQKTGIEEAWNIITDHHQHVTTNGWLQKKRRQQASFWLHDSIRQQLGQRFYQSEKVKAALPDIEAQVKDGRLSPFEAARRLLAL